MDLTRITSTEPKRLSKAFRLDTQGQLAKMPGGQLMDGTAKRLRLADVQELAQLIQSLTPADALVYGIAAHDFARVVAQRLLDTVVQNGGPPLVARTRQFFSYPSEVAVLMLDYDQPGTTGLTSTQFREIIYSVAPTMRHAPHLVTPSASSFIFHGDQCLRGPSGIRLLVEVADGTDIPRTGEALFKRLWLAGHGYIEVSQAGSLLVRGPIDASVWQPERLDFCGGAACEPPLTQRRPAPVVVEGDGVPLDTRQAIPSLNLAEEARYRQLVLDAKNAVQGGASMVRQGWIDSHVAEHIKRDPQADRDKVREIYTQAVEGGQLLGDFILQPSDGDPITVAEVLADPDKWHGRRFADPLEPSYRNDRRIAFLNLKTAGRPYLYSNAHGGRKFFLLRERRVIRIVPGERVRAVGEALQVLREGGQHFNRGGEIVAVSSDAEIFVRDEKAIGFDLDNAARFEKFDSRKNDFTPCDCKPSITSGVMAAQMTWDLPKLITTATAPLLDPVADRVIATDGFDAGTGVLLCLGDLSVWRDVPDKPTDADVENAIRNVWAPFESFPFDGRVTKGVWLSTILTATIRQILPTAPATAITSPIAGSGKTLLAKAASELMGEAPALLPDAKQEDEIRKRLLALLRAGKRLLVLDNITSTLDSAALCTLLTADQYQDRVLSVSEVITVHTQALVLITGNNLSLRGDLCRRVLTARIDPQIETPWKRKFMFDPVAHCRDHRGDIVPSALTIIRAGVQRGPDLPDRTASFERWSDTVRRAVVMVRNLDLLDVDDPVLSIDEAYELDPETSKLSALIEAWAKVFGDKPLTVAEIITAATDGYDAGNNSFHYVNQELHDLEFRYKD